MIIRALPILTLALAAPALAQRTGNNAVTSAGDAFGRSVGNEKIGIYSSEDVRGFNPVEAGNARIEGLYFDQMNIISNRLIDSSAIRVGYAALAFPFPAPTGIVDQALEKYDGKRVISAEIEADLDGNINGSLQAKFPLSGEKLGLSIGQGARHARIPYFRFGDFSSHAAILTWRPRTDAEVNLFWSHFSSSKTGGSPIIYPAGAILPPRLNRLDYLGQDWAHGKMSSHTLGATAKLPLGAFRLEAGLFRSIKDEPFAYTDLAIATLADGTSQQRRINADQDLRAASTSGEARLSRAWNGNGLNHNITLMVRGRDQERLYGGQQVIPLGTTLLPAPVQIAKPSLTFGPQNRSHVKQGTFGMAYDLVGGSRFRVALSAQKTDYRKQVDFGAAGQPSASTRDRPWLFSANGSVHLSGPLTLYAAYVRGLEESPLAPEIATNANEAPPAIRSSQTDVGLRYALTAKLALIAGMFEIRKPYFNLDSTRRFGELATLSNRGVEVSFAGTLAPGLTIIAGSLFLDPRLSGGAAKAGQLGERPVGTFRRHSVANFDWRPAGQDAWSFDVAFDSVSSSSANTFNTFAAPGRETLALGARYRFAIGKAKLMARAQITNMFNNYGWKVSSSGGFTFTQPRATSLSLAADF